MERQPAEILRRCQASHAGPAEGLRDWLDGGRTPAPGQLVPRFAGEHERHLSAVAKPRHA